MVNERDAIVLVTVIVLTGWATMAWLQVREKVLRRARQCCEALNLQLLDDTVAQARLRPARDIAGRLCWKREFRFEFSCFGTERRQGTALTLGARVELVRLDMPDGPVIISTDMNPQTLQ